MLPKVRNVPFDYRSEFLIERGLGLSQDFKGEYDLGKCSCLVVTSVAGAERIKFELKTRAVARRPESFNRKSNRYSTLHTAALNIVDACCAFVWKVRTEPKPFYSFEGLLHEQITNDFVQQYDEASYAATGKHRICSAAIMSVETRARATVKSIARIASLACQCWAVQRKRRVMVLFRDGALAIASKYVLWFKIVEELREVVDDAGLKLLPRNKKNDYILKGRVDGVFLGDFPQPYRHIGGHRTVEEAQRNFPDAWKLENLEESASKYEKDLRVAIDYYFDNF